jgi:L-amino acid N-acyltransferase YncA
MSPIHRMPAYPKQVTLLDGTVARVRPMGKRDERRVLQFFLRIPEEERFFLKEDVGSPKVIAEWFERLDHDRALPMLALVGNRVIADAALIRSRTGSRRHVGEVRLHVDPEFRQRGLGTVLIRELCDIANDAGLERVTVEVVEGVGNTMLEMVERLGFVRAATLREHVKDREGKRHDLATMVLTLGKWHEWWHF